LLEKALDAVGDEELDEVELLLDVELELVPPPRSESD